MVFKSLFLLAALFASGLAVPTGPLYAERLPRAVDEQLREFSKRAAYGQAPYNGGSKDYGYPSGNNPNAPDWVSSSGITNLKDPESNVTGPHSPPAYRVLTPFDYASYNLGIYQEYIELDLFNYALARFSDAEWEDAGINAQYREIIRFMAQQEIGHATLLGNILGPGHAQQCSYSYPFNTVREFLDFTQQLTRWGESGVYGFLSQLNSVDSATLLTNSIVTEARQQLIFRQLGGAFPMPEAFVPGIPQSWQWTLLAPYITSCPTGTPKIQWSNYPALNVTRGAGGNSTASTNATTSTDSTLSLVQPGSKAAVSTNTTAFVSPGEALLLKWEKPGQQVGPDNGYTTLINNSGVATHAAFVTDINSTVAQLYDVTDTSATVYVPDYQSVFPDIPNIGVINATAFLVVLDQNIHVTPFNISLLNTHIVAGPAVLNLG